MKNVVTIQGVHGYVDAQGTAWLNVEDVARGLGFVEAKKFSTSGENYIRWERINSYLAEYNYSQQVGKGDFIPENIFYLLAMKANNKVARDFQRKVANEILPAIRQNGFYATPAKIEEIVRNPDVFINHLITAYQRVKGERDKLHEEVKELKPKADYCELILKSNEVLPVTIIAKDYGMSARRFNRLLRELKIQHHVGKTWVLNQPYANFKYTVTATTPISDSLTVTNTYWTQKGRMFLYNFLKQHAILPLVERKEVLPPII